MNVSGDDTVPELLGSDLPDIPCEPAGQLDGLARHDRSHDRPRAAWTDLVERFGNAL